MSSLPLPLSPAIGATLRAVCDTRAIGGVAAAPVCSATVERLTHRPAVGRVARNEWEEICGLTARRAAPSGRTV